MRRGPAGCASRQNHHEDPAWASALYRLPVERLRPLRARAAALLAVAIVVGAGVVAAVDHNTSVTPARERATSTDPAVFVLPNLRSGPQIRLAAFRGMPLVVNFFASWCTACRADLPAFARLSGHLRGTVAFVGVDSLDNGSGLSFAVALGLGPWPLARDVGERDSGLHDAVGGAGMPVTAFYSPAGTLLHIVLGSLDLRALSDEIHAMFGVTVPNLDE
jgi:thiol-disulfide isomerase/thioredoxin